jgi:N-acetylneuraminic acid mutarotase
MRLLLVIFLLLGFQLNSQLNNIWIEKNDFSGGKRERAVGFSIDNLGYICSGVNTSEISLNDLWTYNPESDSWEQKANLPGSVRRNAIGFSIDGVGYVGMGMDSVVASESIPLFDFWAYHPENNTWEQKADFPGSGGSGIYFATAFTADGKGYVCGGKSGPNDYSNELWEYKPSIDQWTQRANFPGGVRYQLSSFTIYNKCYVGLGVNQDVFKKDFYMYNPGSNEWSQIEDFPSERGSASSFSINNRGYICLGTNGGLLGDLIQYNPDSNEWAIKCSYSGSERKSAVSFVINNSAYVGTGKGYSGKKDSMHQYLPENTLDSPQLSLSDNPVIYPNPTNGFLNILTKSPETIEILDMSGNRINQILTPSAFETIDLSYLPEGIYLIKSSNFEKKIIKE